MKFNLAQLGNLFKRLRQSPIDDMALQAVKNNADDVARVAVNTLDDIPSNAPNLPNIEHFGDMARYIDNGTFPSVEDLTPPPAIKHYTPSTEDLRITPEMYNNYNFDPDDMLFPDGFEDPDDFAYYYDSLALGAPLKPSRTSTTKSGHKVTVPEDFARGMSPTDNIIIDNKMYRFPQDYDIYANHAPETVDDLTRLKANILDRYINDPSLQDEFSFDGTTYDDLAQLVTGYVHHLSHGDHTFAALPHANTALGKFYKENRRLPVGMTLPPEFRLAHPWETFHEGGFLPF